VVPPSLEGAARKLLLAETKANGETNEWQGSAELLVVPWLA
jgi:phage major head subunit gpT-like protein